MKINDEGRSNAAYWYERAMKAEARLAEAQANEGAWEATAQHHYKEARAFENRLAEAEREADLYHIAMEALRSTKMQHGLCQPRERMACTNCNAVDRLDAILAAYKGRRLVANVMGTADSGDERNG